MVNSSPSTTQRRQRTNKSTPNGKNAAINSTTPMRTNPTNLTSADAMPC
ncbi:Uncharacterised protein [Mycobacteroides abscessus subsp. abscessus]|nr:Uncharacterised protein [Mycobacteroides abscessus subsp. abscessus]